MKVDQWGDANIINAISLMWGAKITTITAQGEHLWETRWRARDDLPLEELDFVLIYNGDSHYSVAST